ncbi:50S ribosomal subunit protein L11 [Candidatus Hodgkinia cicadicola]|nr:50S ribosomal subunit protein L11 [Candidatus Hodgkinia cicadicola]
MGGSVRARFGGVNFWIIAKFATSRASLAKPVPPVGSVLEQRRLNAPEFRKRFSELTRTNEELQRLCVKVCVYSDRSYDLVVNAPTLTRSVRQMLLLDRCAPKPGGFQVGMSTRADTALLAARKSRTWALPCCGKLTLYSSERWSASSVRA